MKIKFIIIILISLITITCTKTYSFKIDDIEKRIVVSSFFNSDSVFSVNLTEEASLNDNYTNNNPYDWAKSFKKIENANISIYTGNLLVGKAIYAEYGNYYSNIKPEANNKYKLVVDTENYDQVTAESKLPTLVKITSLEKIKIENDDFFDYTVKIKFEDPANEDNYYLISQPKKRVQYFEIDDPIIKWHTRMQQYPIFSDKAFNGKTYELSLKIDINYNEWDNFEQTVKWNHYIKFHLYSISKEFYLYAKSYSDQQPEYGDNMLDYFQTGLMEPKPIYTNIKNGLGIFAGYSLAVDSLYFE